MSDSATASRLAGLSREQRALLFERLRQRKEQEREAAPPLERIPRRPPDLDPVPASFAQERLWLVDRLQPGLAAYNIPLALRVTGEVSPALLAALLGEVVRRHEALRTTFRVAGNQVAQAIAPAAPWRLPVADLSALPAAARGREAERLAGEEAARPFDLARGPLLRATLLRLAPAEHALLLVMHHIVSDGWSMGVLVREITRLYAAAVAGEPSPLPELEIQYADFAVWQRRWLTGEVLERQLAYWRQRLAGAPAALDLPADRPPPATRGHAGARFHLPLGAGLQRGVALLARRHEATPFMVLLAAFQALLGRLTGAEDLNVGSPIANRNRAEIEPLIGFFVNTLVLRGDLAGDPSFDELVGRARKTTLGAYAHQDLPFERLVEELRPERRLDVSPLFQVLFALQNAPMGTVDLPGLSLSALPFEARTSQFDLEVSAWERGEEMILDVGYSTERFDPATPRRWMGYLETLLRGLVEDPARRASDVPLLAPAERWQVAREWNDTALPLPLDRCLHELVEAQAARSPGAPAVIAEDGELTYAELDARAERLARRLRRLGVGPEVAVGLFAERSAAQVAALLGVLKAGGACVPLDPGYPAGRLAGMLEDAAAPVLVATPDLADKLPPHRGRVLFLDEEEAGTPEAAPAPRPTADNLAAVIFTSGSTGRPKGVMLPHRGLVNRLLWAQGAYRLGPGDAVLLKAALGFDFALWETFAPLLAGARLVVARPGGHVDPAYLARTIQAHGVTLVHFVPSMLDVFLREESLYEEETGELPSLRQVFSGGEALSPALRERFLARFPGVPLDNQYGPTEISIDTTRWVCSPGQDPRRVPLGRPIGNTRVHLLDRAGWPVPSGVTGVLHVGGAGVARGYLGRPALTAERFVPDPFAARPGERLYNTGDLARRLPDGNLEFLGRADQQIKVRGVRVEPREVEAALLRHPAVAAAAVGADAAGARLAAWIVPRPGADATPALLRDFLRESLPEAMLPSLFVPLEALPLTPGGKLDRRALPAPEAAAGAARPVLSTATERLLAGVWSELLGVPGVGAGDDFFDLGGHSLLATRLVSRVRQDLGVELPLRAVFEAPTLAAFAARVDRERGGGEAVPPVRPVPREGPLPLSFAQERLWFLYLLAPEVPVYNLGAAMRLAGRLDPAALAAALSEILRRHETLRTTFRATAAGAVQEVQPWAPLAQPVVDLAGLPAAAREREARRIAAAERAQPFDLQRGPLLRALLLRLGAGEHVALWDTHHIAADGWSLSEVFVPELTRLYAAAVERRPSPLPDLAVQYADYAVWQRERLAGAALEEQTGYWRGQLAGLAPLDLPADRPRPPAPSGRGGGVLWSLPPARTEALGRLARAGDATLFMALFAAFAATLHRETGAAALPVGLPVANRSRAEVEGLIGFFVNTVVLRGDLAGDPGFPELLARARAAVLGALSHQDVPFERLVDELRLPRDPYRPPLLRATFQLQTASSQGPLELPGVTLTPFQAGADPALFDLVVNLFETADGISGYFLHDADLFDTATTARLAGHFTNLLGAWIDEPARPLSGLPLLAPAERHQLLVEWNPAPVPAGGRRCLHRRFEAQADRAPGAVALSFDGERLTYAELDARANRIARLLKARGVRPGDRVALLLERSAGMVAALLGVLKAGAAYVPIDPTSPAERIAFLREDSGAALLLREEDLAAAEGQGAGRLDVPVEADFPVYVIYTSGSTGRPKGVAVTHANVDRLFAATGPWFDFNAEDVWTLFHSYAFDFSVWEIWGALLHGGRLVVVPYWVSRSPEAFHELLREERVTVLNQTPSAFRQLIWASEGKPADLALRYVIFGGEALEPASLAPWIARYGERPRLVNMYGITETTVHVTYRPVGEGDLDGGSRIGAPIPDLAVHLLDPHLQPVPVGVPGEIHVGGAGLAQGYLDRPDLTAGRFIPDPFSGTPGARLYRSGDLARRLPDGDLEYLGRADLQVKIRGFRIELGEIEAALAAQPGVREAVVLARSDGSDRSVRLVAYTTGDAADPSALRRALAERLPDYMIPAAFVFLDALPLTGNGKIDRAALPAPEAAAPSAASHREARDPLDAYLLGQFRGSLGLPAEREIGIGDDFFALGGTSITSAIFAHRLQEGLGETFHVVAVFDHPTVAALADYLRERHPAGARRLLGEEAPVVGGPERSVLVPIQEGSPGRRPLFCVHSVGGEVVAYRPLARHLGPEQPVYGLQSPDPPLESIPGMAALYLAAVRAVQPRGPYRLAGWSMGGAVAYEMARQLEAEGERTEVLAMIDAVSAASWSGEQRWSDTEMLGLFAVAMVYLHDVDVPADLDLPPALGVPQGFDLSSLDISGLSLDDALAAALDLGRQVGLLPPSLTPEELRRIFERFRANRVSLSLYRPETYGGELHLFRARGQAGMGDDPTLGWSRLVKGEIHIFDCPGDHYTILREEVEGLAVQLRGLLGG